MILKHLKQFLLVRAIQNKSVTIISTYYIDKGIENRCFHNIMGYKCATASLNEQFISLINILNAL